jgi:hypothetical protein
MSTPRKRLEDLVQTKSEEVRKAKAALARKAYDENDWRQGYSTLYEGALGDYPEE